MNNVDYNKYLKKKFQQEVKNTFNAILEEKFITSRTKGKEVIKFDKIETSFHKLNYLCEFDEETKSFITKLYADLKQNGYFITLGMQKVEVVDAKFVVTAMEKYHW